MKITSFFGVPGRLAVRRLLQIVVLAVATQSGLAQGVAAVTRKVEPGDGLVISVDEPDLQKVEKKVDADGKISFPYLGELDVKGKTTTDIEKLIRDGLDKDWIINPQVSVVVAAYAEKVVVVKGFVNMPGTVKMPPDRKLSLEEAVSLAHDVSPKGNRHRVQLSRNGETKTYDLDKLSKETDSDKKVYVEPDDVINVREGFF